MERLSVDYYKIYCLQDSLHCWWSGFPWTTGRSPSWSSPSILHLRSVLKEETHSTVEVESKAKAVRTRKIPSYSHKLQGRNDVGWVCNCVFKDKFSILCVHYSLKVSINRKIQGRWIDLLKWEYRHDYEQPGKGRKKSPKKNIAAKCLIGECRLLYKKKNEYGGA